MNVVSSQWSVVSRRIFSCALCAMLFALCVSAEAQQAGKIFRIGFLDPSNAAGMTVNRLVRRKLKLSLLLLGAYVVVHIVVALELAPDAAVADEQLISIERLAFVAGLINLVVISFLNPLREDRVPDRYPAILQDFIVIGLLVLVATLVFHDKLLTTSAVSAVVIGFALQDTLGNAFAGLAIQSETAIQRRSLDSSRRL